MADTPVRSRRPYLLRAMHEWISDSDQTPHIVVDASIEGVEVPRQYVQGGKIILNVSSNATSMLNLGNDVRALSRALRRRDLRRERADRRGARHLRARDRAGNDFLGGGRAAAAAAAPPSEPAADGTAKASAPSRR